MQRVGRGAPDSETERAGAPVEDDDLEFLNGPAPVPEPRTEGLSEKEAAEEVIWAKSPARAPSPLPSPQPQV